MQPRCVLTIAGSDSGAGAGIQADLKTFGAFGLYGTTALSAVTAQNTRGVNSVVVIDADELESQIRSVSEDFAIIATKTGMLATASNVQRVAALAEEGLFAHLVVDPVLVATSGDVLMEESGICAYRDTLFPFADIITPNLREAALLCERDTLDIRTLDEALELAQQLLSFGPTYVLLKGGHHPNESPDDRAIDILCSGDATLLLDAERVSTRNDHGTGCSLSAAIVSGLALEREMTSAVKDAKSYVLSALKGASEWRLGEGRGPLDHLGWTK